MERVIQDLPHETIEKLNYILGETVDISNADRGTLQIYDPEKDLLLIISHHGFSDDFLSHFKYVKPFDGSACGRAAGTGNVVTIYDVSQDTAFTSHLETAVEAGIRAVKSIPLRNEGRLVGVLSVHYKEVRKCRSGNTLTAAMASDIACSLNSIIELKARLV